MKFSLRIATIGAMAVLVPAAGAAIAGQATTKGLAVAYPFAFTKGTKTAHSSVYEAVAGIAQKAGYAAIPQQVAENAWDDLRLPDIKPNKLPNMDELSRFAGRVKANIVLYGVVSWHVKSVFVDTGPKTISEAKVTVYVYSAQRHAVIFTSKKDVDGRSDEKENLYKDAADILLTPVISVVSGGPETPQDQRAAQIALARALHPWAKRNEEDED